MCLRPNEIYSYFQSLWSYFYHYIIQKGGDLKGIFIGPESDHWLCMSVTPSLTHSLTHCCLVNLIDVTLACEDANSKLVEVVSVADVDDENRDSNSLLQIWKLRFDHKT